MDLPVIENDLSKIKFSDRDIDKVINRMEKILKKIANREDFNPQYFFKSANSLKKILDSRDAKVDYEIILTRDNRKRYRDLRYYKPEEFSIEGDTFLKIKHWNDLFVWLMDEYSVRFGVREGNLDFIDSGSRILLLKNPIKEERKLRKQLKNGLWLLTNFDSKKISDFCYAIAEELGFNLSIKLRPTRYRVQRKYRKKRKRRNT